MPRGRKRDANAVQVTVRPNADGGSAKKTKTFNTKSRYSTSKKFFNKPSKNGTTRTVDLVGSYRAVKAVARNTIASIVQPANDINTIQPMGRDQMFAMYSKAYVKSAEQEVYLQLPMANNVGTNPMFVTINHWCDNNGSASADEAESTQRCLSKDGKHIVKTRLPMNASSSDQVAQVAEDVVHSKCMGTTMGVTHRGFNEPDASQTASSAPTLLWYFHLEIYVMNNTDSTQTYFDTQYSTVTNYNCIFWDPVELAVS